MTHAKHTPGSWHATGLLITADNHEAGGIFVAEVKPTNPLTADGYAEGKANARLIAAAPRLLQALKDMILFENSHTARRNAINLIKTVEGYP